MEKAKRRLEMEKEELQAALEEAESALEQEEAKVMRAQMEVSTVRADIDKRVREKDEEFENTRYGKIYLVKLFCSLICLLLYFTDQLY